MSRRKPVTIPRERIDYSQPCKNGQPYVAADGSCLRCGADQGVACRAAPQETSPGREG